MTLDEWRAISARIDLYWPNSKMGELQEAAYFEMLARFDAQVVIEAVQALALDGREFPPPVGVIAKKCETSGMAASPPWLEAWPVIRKALASCGANGQDRGLERLAAHAPVVAEFVKSMGWRQMATAPVEADNGGVILSRWAREYADFAGGWDGKVRELSRGGGLRRIDGGAVSLDSGEAA